MIDHSPKVRQKLNLEKCSDESEGAEKKAQINKNEDRPEIHKTEDFRR